MICADGEDQSGRGMTCVDGEVKRGWGVTCMHGNGQRCRGVICVDKSCGGVTSVHGDRFVQM